MLVILLMITSKNFFKGKKMWIGINKSTMRCLRVSVVSTLVLKNLSSTSYISLQSSKGMEIEGIWGIL